VTIESSQLRSHAAFEPAYPPALPPKDLPCEDGVPLESAWHFLQIALLIELVNGRFDAFDDFYAGGNMFIYFNLEQLKNQDFRGPDFFYVKGVARRPLRKYWATWDEGGRLPDFLLELLSPSTAAIDRTTKKDIYEKVFRTPEYFLYDPDADHLEGWRLDANQRYQSIQPGDSGRIQSEQLGGWIGRWQGAYQGQPATWLRLFDEHRNPWPTQAERLAQAQAEIGALQARLAERKQAP
jgi:Uma2 family endonuclease